ncbi:uncharacterized protein LOC144122932 [Amblyomma americanum]
MARREVGGAGSVSEDRLRWLLLALAVTLSLLCLAVSMSLYPQEESAIEQDFDALWKAAVEVDTKVMEHATWKKRSLETLQLLAGKQRSPVDAQLAHLSSLNLTQNSPTGTSANNMTLTADCAPQKRERATAEGNSGAGIAGAGRRRPRRSAPQRSLGKRLGRNGRRSLLFEDDAKAPRHNAAEQHQRLEA